MELSTSRSPQGPGSRATTPESFVDLHAMSPHVSVVTLAGEHDLATAEQVSAGLILASEQSNIVIDLTCCDFLDASILALIVTRVRALDATKSLSIVAPSTNAFVARVLALSGVRQVCDVHESIADASELLLAGDDRDATRSVALA